MSDLMLEGVGLCNTCKHFSFVSGKDGPFSDLAECEMWDTEEWKKWEDVFNDMEQAGVSFECPLWEPRYPELRYCVKHRTWYDAEFGCPSCIIEDAVSAKFGVIL